VSHSKEAFWWSLFSAGGVMAALFMPALIVATGLILPARDPAVSYEAMSEVHAFWLVRFAIFGVLMLTMFHCAHRIKHILMDLGLRGLSGLLTVVCYGGAAAGSVIAGLVLFVRWGG
jgi:fumarate reductase subunit D